MSKDDASTILARLDERTFYMKESIDNHVKISNERHKEYIGKFKDHDERISKNTTFRNWLAGGMFFGGGSLGALFGKFWNGQ